jgi:hypothetical protein
MNVSAKLRTVVLAKPARPLRVGVASDRLGAAA